MTKPNERRSGVMVLFWTLVVLTALQLLAGFVALWLWAFDLVTFPTNAVAAFYLGPFLTGIPAAFLAVAVWDD